ncbi:MAG: DUF2231 domain-containing protein [Solirubrobacteraceae bacterium]
MTNPLNAAAERLEGVQALDLPARTIGTLVRRAIPPGPAKTALSGAWLGHALHPLLTDVPIGTFTSAVLLDLLGGRGSEDSADKLIALGIVSVPGVVATGWSDWADEEARSPAIRRAGVVHAVLNVASVGMMGASLLARRGGDRARGKALALAGMGVMGSAGWLGGHLSYTKGSRVEPEPSPAL